MGFVTDWLIPEKVILVQCEGEMTVETLGQVAESIISRVDSVTDKRVHVITDSMKVTKSSSDIQAIMRTIRQNTEVSHGWVIGVTATRLQALVMTVIGQMMRVGNVKNFTNMDDALNFLQGKDRSLPDLNAAYVNFE